MGNAEAESAKDANGAGGNKSNDVAALLQH